jgi:hypothetical protein
MAGNTDKDCNVWLQSYFYAMDVALTFGHLFDMKSYEELVAYGRGCIENAKIVIENEARKGVAVRVLDIGLADFYWKFAEKKRLNYNNELTFDVFGIVRNTSHRTCTPSRLRRTNPSD